MSALEIENARLRRRVAQLEFMIEDLVFLSSDGRVLAGYRTGVDLTDRLPGLRELAQPVKPLREHLRG